MNDNRKDRNPRDPQPLWEWEEFRRAQVRASSGRRQRTDWGYFWKVVGTTLLLLFVFMFIMVSCLASFAAQ
jgi:hypothetical protein